MSSIFKYKIAVSPVGLCKTIVATSLEDYCQNFRLVNLVSVSGDGHDGVSGDSGTGYRVG